GSDARLELPGVEPRDETHAGLAGDGGGPRRLHTDAQGSDQTEARDDDSAGRHGGGHWHTRLDDTAGTFGRSAGHWTDRPLVAVTSCVHARMPPPNLCPGGRTMKLQLVAPRSLRQRKVDRLAVGALAVGATALGALAIGALAVGSIAIGKMAIGRLVARSFTIKSLKIESLEVGEWSLPAGAEHPSVTASRAPSRPG